MARLPNSKSMKRPGSPKGSLISRERTRRLMILSRSYPNECATTVVIPGTELIGHSRVCCTVRAGWQPALTGKTAVDFAGF